MGAGEAGGVECLGMGTEEGGRGDATISCTVGVLQWRSRCASDFGVNESLDTGNTSFSSEAVVWNEMSCEYCSQR